MKREYTSQIPLSDLATLEQGHLFRKGISNLPMGYISLIQPNDVVPGKKLNIDGLHKVRYNDIKESSILKKNDIIIKTKAANPIALIVEPGNNQFAVTNHFTIIRITDKNASPKYLTWFLNTKQTQAYLSRMMVGTSVPFLKKTTLMDLNIPVPDRKMQERIVMMNELHEREDQLTLQIIVLKKDLVERISINLLEGE